MTTHHVTTEGLLLVVPAHRQFAAEHPEIRANRGSVVALEAGPLRLVLMEANHAELGGHDHAALTVDQARLVLSVQTAFTTPATTGSIWEAERDERDLVAAFDPIELAPAHPTWRVPGRTRSIWLHDAESGVQVVFYRSTPVPVTGRDAANDVLQLLLALASRSPTARRVLAVLLAGQPLRAVSIKKGRPQPEHADLAGVRADRSAAFLWDRSATVGTSFLIAGSAAALSGMRRSNPKTMTFMVPPAAVMHVEQRLRESAADLGGVGPGLYMSAPDESPGWVAVPGACVEHDGHRWRIGATPPIGWGRRTVDRIALVADRRLHFDPPAGSTLGGAVQSLRELTHRRGEHQVDVARPAAAMRPQSIAGAVRATRARAASLLRRPREPDTAALDLIFTSYLDGEGLPDLDEALTDALDRVRLRQVEERAHGREVLALIAVQHTLHDRPHGDLANPRPFADALTCYVDAVHATGPEPPDWLWARVAEFAARWLSVDPERASGTTTLQPSHWQHVGDLAWEELAAEAPWLRWLAQSEHDQASDGRLTPLQYVEALILLRPGRRDQRFDLRRWRRIYPSSVPLTDAKLRELAKCLEPFPYQPVETARLVHGVNPPDALREAIDALVSEALPQSQEQEHLLVVRVDDAGQARVVLVNLATDRPLDVRLGDRPLRLAPRAIEQPMATGYCSDPLDIDSEAVAIVGQDSVPLAAQPSELDSETDVTLHMLPHELFRGRRAELARLMHTLEGDGPRAGNLIFGTRRAGKSSLAYRVATDTRASGHVWLDMSDTPVSVESFDQWAAHVVRNFRRQTAKLGVTLDDTVGDLVEAIRELDEAIAGRPAVVVLDELDVLLLPEQDTGGRRLAGRLGSLITHSVVLIGTVQRFHDSTHEFKYWNHIECKADLNWSDGVGYFFMPLIDERPGPRVERLTRVGVMPALFRSEIEPWTGLRPYFWAQLRAKLAGHLRSLPPGSTPLIDMATLRHQLEALITDDPHLNVVMDSGQGLSEADRRRRDLFSLNERRILVLFANVEVGSTVPVARAIRVGGYEGVRELVDRAYVRYDDTETQLRIAVPLYHRFLRLRRTDLIAVTPSAIWGLPGQGQGIHHGAMLAGADEDSKALSILTEKDMTRAREAVQQAIEANNGFAPLSAIANSIRLTAPAVNHSSWAETGSARAFVETFCADLARIDADTEVFYGWPSHASAMARLQADAPDGPADLNVDEVRAIVLGHLRKRGGSAQMGTVVDLVRQCSATGGGVRMSKAAGQRLLDALLPDLRRMRGNDGQVWLLTHHAPAADFDDVLRRVRDTLADELALADPLPLSQAGHVLRKHVPELADNNFFGAGNLTHFIDVHLDDLQQVPGEAGGFLTMSGQHAPPTDANPRLIAEARRVLVEMLEAAGTMETLSHVSTQLSRIPEMQGTRWAGAGTLTRFLNRHLSEFPRASGPSGGFIGSPTQALPLPAPARPKVRAGAESGVGERP